MQFYCYLPKRANYIWSLMWNLLCGLSVSKLCGSSQAAYLTFSGPFPHTSSSTLTRAGSPWKPRPLPRGHSPLTPPQGELQPARRADNGALTTFFSFLSRTDRMRSCCGCGGHMFW